MHRCLGVILSRTGPKMPRSKTRGIRRVLSRHVKLSINLNSSIFNRCGEKVHHGRNKWIMLLSLDSQTSHGQLSSNVQLRLVTFMIFLLCNPARDGASSTTFPGTSSVIHESVHVAAAAIRSCPELPTLRNSRRPAWWGLPIGYSKYCRFNVGTRSITSGGPGIRCGGLVRGAPCAVRSSSGFHNQIWMSFERLPCLCYKFISHFPSSPGIHHQVSKASVGCSPNSTLVAHSLTDFLTYG